MIPTSSWANDPFGYSPVMAYLLREIGLESMMIQRAHYSMKKQLAQHKQLEFGWLQQWDHSGYETAILCHLMPFYSYDIPHTCGPEPKVQQKLALSPDPLSSFQQAFSPEYALREGCVFDMFRFMFVV